VEPGLKAALEGLVDRVGRGDPESPLRWACKSTRVLAQELSREAHPASEWLVRQLLREQGYSVQANRKTTDGTRHPDRDAELRYIAAAAARQLRCGRQATSVDTKKKELVRDFENAGRTRRPCGTPEPACVHGFLDPTKETAIPYGVYDLGRHQGWVSVAVDRDTGAFAVNTIRRWWREIGAHVYGQTSSLLTVAESGGSNGTRTHLWK
jgi:hypothetical protein